MYKKNLKWKEPSCRHRLKRRYFLMSTVNTTIPYCHFAIERQFRRTNEFVQYVFSTSTPPLGVGCDALSINIVFILPVFVS